MTQTYAQSAMSLDAQEEEEKRKALVNIYRDVDGSSRLRTAWSIHGHGRLKQQ
jgi:hypothetical protein